MLEDRIGRSLTSLLFGSICLITVLTTLGAGGCSPGSNAKELRNLEVRRQFEEGVGRPIPDGATDLRGYRGKSDFFGDYSLVLSFRVPEQELEALSSLPPARWKHPEQLSWTLAADRDLSAGDSTLPGVEGFVAPAFCNYVEQRGPGDIVRFYAIDRKSRRILYYQATW